ncbi:maestro heat-like repeat family member 5 isoform X1 [Ornithorhynchus anatinus]|uniref:maestro heat-like repeat family member 5 isoform X1 n=1 Tax=Ornithorhynchus anatinus TaxID=9258 RepID=UPI0010A81908|nr:maestro heat-like repeat family member 5 isoform X1 [Ornithorhynchus anatinus]
MGRKGSAQKGFLPLARVAPAPEETEVKLEVMSNERCFELVLDELYGVQSHGDLVAWVRNLTSAHLSFLSLKVLIGLRSSNLTRVAHAVRILSILLQVPKALDDQAADLARSVYEQLISSGLQAEKNLLQEALALLGRHHTREIVQVFLEYSRPLNREVLEVLKCVGADASIASLVLWALLRKVFGRPQREESNCTKWERHTLSSIAAVNTLYELLFVVEYSGAVAQLLPQLFLAFIIQIQYVLELGLVGERVLLAVQPTVPSALSPWRTALEALRGLLSKDVCVGCWQSFTSMELQDGWQLFWSLETFQEGVALLARTLVQSRCPMVAELLQTVVSSLLGKDRQGRSVAVGLLAELIWIPALKTVVDPKVVRFILQEGLEDPDPVVRVISLQALTSLPLNPNKRPMLLAQLPFFLEGFYREDQEGALAAMDAAILTARNLGSGGLGRLSKDIIRMLGPFFDDVSLKVPAGQGSSCCMARAQDLPPRPRLGQSPEGASSTAPTGLGPSAALPQLVNPAGSYSAPPSPPVAPSAGAAFTPYSPSRGLGPPIDPALGSQAPKPGASSLRPYPTPAPPTHSTGDFSSGESPSEGGSPGAAGCRGRRLCEGEESLPSAGADLLPPPRPPPPEGRAPDSGQKSQIYILLAGPEHRLELHRRSRVGPELGGK